MCMEASGTYCRQVMHGKEQKNQTNSLRSLERNLMCFFYTFTCFFFALQVYYISEGFKACFVSFWSYN